MSVAWKASFSDLVAGTVPQQVPISKDVRSNAAIANGCIGMESHLALLRELFPRKVLLEIDDVCQVLGLSKASIYNMSYRQELPFKCAKITDRIQVSIIEMGRYLDSKCLEMPLPEPVQEGQSVRTKSKVGRPKKLAGLTVEKKS